MHFDETFVKSLVRRDLDEQWLLTESRTSTGDFKIYVFMNGDDWLKGNNPAD